MPNELHLEDSPYLLQHATNPVHWRAWSQATLELAKQEQKPLLVSIGYSTCHWCHVMNRESFSDDKIANIINKHFIAIKVDREERPDVDAVFMRSMHLFGNQGGWPLNVFCTEDGTPFFIGTYYPPTPKLNLPSFTQVLEAVSEQWQSNQKELFLIGEDVKKAFKKLSATSSSKDSSAEKMDDVEKIIERLINRRDAESNFYKTLHYYYDEQLGGFSFHQTNKFPPCMVLSHLLRLSLLDEKADKINRSNIRASATIRAYGQSLAMVEKTLTAMCSGGIYDHLGGGLYRYSTTTDWLIPHFEKMLYDNALLSWCLLECYQLTEDSIYYEWASDVLDYISRDLVNEAGAFCSAEDADTRGHEGLFYLWEFDDFEAALSVANFTQKEIKLLMYRYGVKQKGVFEGKNILSLNKNLEECHQYANNDLQLAISIKQLPKIFRSARQSLLVARQKRDRPERDDKVVTAWNALMMRGFCKAYKLFGDKKYIQQAKRAYNFVMQNLTTTVPVQGANRLVVKRSFLLNTGTGTNHQGSKSKDAKHEGLLSDYALLALASLDLYEITFEMSYWQNAKQLTDSIEVLFAEESNQDEVPLSLLYDVRADLKAPAPMVRLVDTHDGSEPAGNSLACELFVKMASYVGEQRYQQRAWGIVHSTKDIDGLGSPYLLRVYFEMRLGLVEVVVVGERENAIVQKMLSIVYRLLGITVNLALVDIAQEDMVTSKIAFSSHLNEVLDQKVAFNKKDVFVIVCHHRKCSAKLTTVEELQDALYSIGT